MYSYTYMLIHIYIYNNICLDYNTRLQYNYTYIESYTIDIDHVLTIDTGSYTIDFSVVSVDL